MSSFICEECGCIDNTAMNNSFHSRKFDDMYSDTRALCQVCSPKCYIDGTPVSSDIWGNVGEWHNRFPREHWSVIGREKIMALYHKNNGSYVNALEFFQQLDNSKIEKDL